jgi:hypothetical protein
MVTISDDAQVTNSNLAAGYQAAGHVHVAIAVWRLKRTLPMPVSHWKTKLSPSISRNHALRLLRKNAIDIASTDRAEWRPR